MAHFVVLGTSKGKNRKEKIEMKITTYFLATIASLTIFAAANAENNNLDENELQSNSIKQVDIPVTLVIGDTCSDPFLISSIPYFDTQNTCDFTNTCNISGNDVQDVIYQLDITTTTMLDISICVSGFSPTIAIFQTDCCTGPGTEWRINSGYSGCNGGSGARIIETFAPGTYYIDVEGYLNCGSYEIDIIEYPGLGRCCLDGTCVDNFDRIECFDQGGTSWDQGMNCSDSPPCPVPDSGACCVGTNCLTTTLETCNLFPGDWYIGEDCTTFQCPVQEVGACCSNGSNCTEGVTESYCTNLGGQWYPGLTCADITDCAGACCVGASCMGNMEQFFCENAFLGTWYIGEDCATFNCNNPNVGACCVDGNCVGNFTEATCLSFGGSWHQGEDCAIYSCSTESIPTLSEWGMLIMGLLLLASGTIAIIRKRKTVHINS